MLVSLFYIIKDLCSFFPPAFAICFVALATFGVVSFVFHLVKLVWGLIGK